MTRFVRPFVSLGILLLASVVWTCHGDSGTNPHGPATSLTFTAGPANVVAGVPIANVTVTALDANGHTATDFASAVTLSILPGTGTPGATISGTTTVNASLGVASFTTLSIDKTGSGYSLQAAASGLTSGASPTFSVACGSATQLAFTTQPAGTTAGVAIAPAVKVTAQDALGNTCSSFTGSVTVAITSGTGALGATLSGTPSATAVAGIATFADLKIDKVGAVSAGTGYTLSATAPSLTAATSDPFDIQSGSATHLQFTSQPTGTAAGAEFSPLVEVSALDAAGNVATTFSGNVTLAIGTNVGGATLGGTKVVAATNGVATFHGIFLDKVGSGYALSASASGLTAATSAAFNVAAGPAANLAFTTQPVTTTDAAPIPPVRISARDAFGNLADGFAGNVTIAIAQNPGGGTLSGTTTLAATQGAASFTDLMIDKVGAAYTLSASAAGVSAATSAAFDIVASTAAKLVCTVQPTNTVAGTAIAAIQVTARDASNQTVTSFTGGVTIAIGTNPGGGSLTGTTTVSAASGVATFSGLSIDKSGIGYTLTTTSAGLQSASCGPFDVTGGTASQLAFTVQPTNVGAGTTIHPQVEVTAHDALGNIATGFTGTVTLAIANNPSGGTLSGTASVAAVAGVAAFNNLSINNAGPAYTLSASAAGPSSATSAAFDVTAGAPSQLVFTAQPPNAAAGATLTPAVQVTAKDGSGNVVTTFNGAVTLSITSGTGAAGAILSGTKTVTAVSGVANFGDLSVDRAGTGYTLSATAVGLAGATSTSFSITSGAATRLAFTAQPVSAGAGASLGTITVAALDAQGNTVSSYTSNVTIAIGANPGDGALSGTATVAAVAGVATFSGLSIDKSGAGYTLSAASAALTGATSTSFTISAGAATALAFTVQPSNATAGTAIAPAIHVSARDAFGNPVTSFAGTVQIAITTNPAGGALSGATSVVASGGVATFSTLSIDKAGNGYTVSASAAGLTGVASAPFNIGPATATTLVFTQQPTTATTNANLTPAVKVTARDALGNTATSFNGNITIAIGANPGGGALSGTRTLAAVNGVASYQALSINNIGTGYTLTAAAAGLTTATSATFNIIASVGTQLFFSVQPPDPATAGVALSPSLVVIARDASGQTATSFTGNVTLAIAAGTGAPGATLSGSTSVTAVAGTATFTGLSINKAAVGYKLTATASGLTPATSAFFTINPGTATQLSFTLQPSTTTVATAITPKVEVTARDALGNTATAFGGSVALAIAANPGSGVLGGTATVAAANGVASFTNLTISQAGNGYTLSAAATGLTGSTSAAFDVTAARATQLGFSVQPSSVTAGASIAPTVTVTARDATGSVAIGFSGAVTLSISAGTGTAGATLSGTVTANAVAGVATFSNLSIDNSGTGYRLNAVGAGVSGATSTPFTVNPGAAARVTFTVHPGSAASATIIPGATGPTIQATVRDALGNPVKTFNGNVTIAIVTNPVGGSLSGTTTVATANGVANFNDLTIDKASAGYRLGITAAGLAPDTSNAFSISAGAATSLLFTVQPSNTTAGGSISPAIRVTAFDAQGNQATAFSGNVTLAIADNPGGGTLSGTTIVGAANGVAVFSGLSINLAGVGYTLQATAAGLVAATSVAFSIN
ncbi:MAG TPA: hypothetical protein VFI79_13610 [Gemmatimonadales bacterium]|nr:hypothetical protein [Gemmatimonadales bacterium]